MFIVEGYSGHEFGTLPSLAWPWLIRQPSSPLTTEWRRSTRAVAAISLCEVSGAKIPSKVNILGAGGRAERDRWALEYCWIMPGSSRLTCFRRWSMLIHEVPLSSWGPATLNNTLTYIQKNHQIHLVLKQFSISRNEYVDTYYIEKIWITELKYVVNMYLRFDYVGIICRSS